MNKTENDASRIISNNNKIHPSKPVLPSLPKAKSLYDYKPQDKDEIELKEGDILEILKERKFKLILILKLYIKIIISNIYNIKFI